MNTLIVLPTLDGSRESAITRLEAWTSAPARRSAAERAQLRSGTLGELRDRLSLLDVA